MKTIIITPINAEIRALLAIFVKLCFELRQNQIVLTLKPYTKYFKLLA